MSEFLSLSQAKLKDFLQGVLDYKNLLIAPVKTDLIRFQKIKSPEEVSFEDISYFPIKEYFFVKNEKIFEYKQGKIKQPKIRQEQKVFFGLRRCDLSAIAHQDKVFLEGDHKDVYYEAMRKNSILIGYHCNKAPHKNCFCGSMDLEDYYDIMFFPKARGFLIHVQTEEGQRFLKPYRKLFTPRKYKLTEKDRKIPGTNKLRKKDIRALFNHPDWKKGVDKCLSCSACTILCPTCYCHEMRDVPELCNATCGKRERCWSSCQLKSFTRVAENFVFRDQREERFKHRIYHQLQYFRDKNGTNLCVGCGRCIFGCPTRIDFVKILNEMKKPGK